MTKNNRNNGKKPNLSVTLMHGLSRNFRHHFKECQAGLGNWSGIVEEGYIGGWVVGGLHWFWEQTEVRNHMSKNDLGYWKSFTLTLAEVV